jgi:hypothetical protein
MKIELLYVPECPNHQPALEQIRRVLVSESLHVEIQEIEVKNEAMAESLHFPGSPTVRVNGADVAEDQRSSYALACRLYAEGGGVPSEALLRKAISGAKRLETSR